MSHPFRMLPALFLGCGALTVGCSDATPPATTPTEATQVTTPVSAPLPLDQVLEALGSNHPEDVTRARDAIRLALHSRSTEDKLTGLRFALHPQAQLVEEVLPLLTDATVEVRRAAVLVAGPAPDPTHAVAPEALFPCLHDDDAEVRELATSALKSRGLDAMQIELARKLCSPETRDRLQLLLDLALETQAIPDPGPWLERLSRDPEPAVRAATARVALERQLSYTAWLDRLAESDPDATVRRLAAWYRKRCVMVQPAGYVEK
ncbi:MAG: hypothetical protein LC104_22250 [Bacteroidales bacterium]|nr:hypothetical protein [Bacteroidales bacterium]